ncbi:hypothetical protein GF362_06455 [Candidatus Dojkabacteria bacterium]|nr:hypothetical protein [Candidatus Dojkabacteria bacterium]
MNINEQIQNIRAQNILTSTPQERRAGNYLGNAFEKLTLQSPFKGHNPRTIGIEAEFSLVHSDLSPIDESLRDQIIDDANLLSNERGGLFSFQPELGAFQIEANQEEIFSQGFSPDKMVELFTWLDDCLVDAANDKGASVLKMGLHPTLELNNIVRTSKPKYEQVPNHHIENRVEDSFVLMEELGLEEEPDATVVSACNSIQFNMSATSPEEAVDLVNWSIQMSPFLVAITGNSRFAEGVDTGWNEPRNRLWDMTHLTETGHRVFLPDGFFDDVEDVFEHMAKHPLILEPSNEFEALAIATGTNWLASKLKFITDEDLDIERLLVEFRPISTQQSPEANAAAMTLSIGRLLWALENEEPLLDFEAVENNSSQAQKLGLDGKFTVSEKVGDNWEIREVSGWEMRDIEIRKAIEGLVATGSGDTAEIEAFFKENLAEMEPSRVLLQKLEDEGGIENKQVLKDVLINVLSANKILT